MHSCVTDTGLAAAFIWIHSLDVTMSFATFSSRVRDRRALRFGCWFGIPHGQKLLGCYVWKKLRNFLNIRKKAMCTRSCSMVKAAENAIAKSGCNIGSLGHGHLPALSKLAAKLSNSIAFPHCETLGQ